MRIGVDDKSIWQRFRRNVSITLLGSGVSVAIKLGQTALLTRLLKIDDYGRVLIVLNLFVFLDSFFGLRVADVMFRFFQKLKDQEDARSLNGLLILCLGISLASGVLIYGGVLILSPWLADRVYPGLGLSPLLNIYGCTVLVSAFSGVYEPILRIYDRFTAIVVPQVLGSLVTLLLLCASFATNLASPAGGYNLKAIVAAFAIGGLVQSVPPLVQALRVVSPYLSVAKVREAAHSLAAHRRELTSCLFNSNLSGYLKFAINPGDLFILGLFSSPSQVALYGLAKQLTAPMALLQTNLQTAVIPEITSLVARGRFAQLRRLINRYLLSAAALGSLLLVSALLLGRLLFLRLFQQVYLPALPVYYVLVVVASLLLIFLVFRPLAVSLDLLRWHNMALLVSAALVICLIIAGDLNAMTMAYIQLAEALILRSLFSVLVWVRLRALAGD
ncbi:MAG: oligosaccharide flippase family protein [Pyrinomonadaceae bacterium]|nr:oligosaccharide flippase family protein [Pyrinomonadaceae bacterium]